MMLVKFWKIHKSTEFKVGGSSSKQPLSNKDKKGKRIIIEEDEKEVPPLGDEEFKVIIDPHTKKMEKLHNQLEVLMHRKDLRKWGS